MRDTRASTRRPVFVSPDNDGTDATSHLAVGELRFLLPSKYDLSDVGGFETISCRFILASGGSAGTRCPKLGLGPLSSFCANS